MPKKPKFRPKITRVKLSHEQAVLVCSCYLGMAIRAIRVNRDGPRAIGNLCFKDEKALFNDWAYYEEQAGGSVGYLIIPENSFS